MSLFSYQISLAFILIWVGSPISWAEMKPMPVPGRLLVVAPHPDDVLLAAGLMQRVRAAGGEARVVDMTCGDSNSSFALKFVARRDYHEHVQPSINYGYWRQAEDHAANLALGARSQDVVYLGYPDGGMWEILARSMRGESTPFTSPNTFMQEVPYRNAQTPGAPYVTDSVVSDLVKQILEFKPDMIVVTHPNDHHLDHASSFYFLKQAIEKSGVDPASITVFTPLDEYGYTFPMSLKRDQRFTEPKNSIPSPTQWYELELKPDEIENKITASALYKSQMAWEHPFVDIYQGRISYMFGYVGVNELYGVVSEIHDDPKFRDAINKRLKVTRPLSVVGNVVTDWFRAQTAKRKE